MTTGYLALWVHNTNAGPESNNHPSNNNYNHNSNDNMQSTDISYGLDVASHTLSRKKIEARLQALVAPTE